MHVVMISFAVVFGLLVVLFEFPKASKISTDYVLTSQMTYGIVSPGFTFLPLLSMRKATLT